MKLVVAFLVLAATSLAAVANTEAHNQHQQQAQEAMTTDELTRAEVRKLDMEYGKITLKHEPIKSLGMPGMTMVFQIKDKALFDGLAEGDTVLVKIEKQGRALVVTALDKLPHSAH